MLCSLSAENANDWIEIFHLFVHLFIYCLLSGAEYFCILLFPGFAL